MKAPLSWPEKNRLEKLEELDIAQNEIGDEGILALSDSTRFPNLVAVYADNKLWFHRSTGRSAGRFEF